MIGGDAMGPGPMAPAVTPQLAAQLLDIKIFDHFVLGLPEREDGKGFVSIEEVE